MSKEKYVAYVGTYTHENSVGIHIYDVDVEQARLIEKKVVTINNPSNLVISKNKKFLYSIADEGVEAFQILEDGDLESINRSGIGGMRGCYLEVDDENRYLFVGGHHDGRVSMLSLNEDGSLGKIADGIFHKGMGRMMIPGNTEQHELVQHNYIPHVECVKLTPDQKFLCAVDSGLDHTKVYRVDYEKGKLKLTHIIRGGMQSAPRMIRFSLDGKYAYILYEMANVIEVYRYDGRKNVPVFEKIQTISTMAEGDSYICAASGLEVSPSGNYLYCSNSGINSVVCYEINKETGMLMVVFNTRVNSDYPKVIAILPDDEHYLTLNNVSNAIMVYKAEYEKKYSLWKGKPIKLDKPNCISIMKLSQ